MHGAINNNNSGFQGVPNGDPTVTHFYNSSSQNYEPISLTIRTDGLVPFAVYLLRGFLEYFRLGAQRTLMYELMGYKCILSLSLILYRPKAY